MVIIQLILLIFSLFMIYITRIHFQRGQIKRMEYVFWVMLWLVFMSIVIVPNSVQGIAESLQVGRVFDLLVIVAFMFLTMLSMQNRLSQYQLKQKFERLIREKALQEKKRK